MTKSLKDLAPGDRIFGIDNKHCLISEVVKIEPSPDGNKEKDNIHLKLFSIGTPFCRTRGNIRNLFSNKKLGVRFVNSLDQDLEERRLYRKINEEEERSLE